MPEFVENFCHDQVFRKVFGVQTLSSCYGIPYRFESKGNNYKKSRILTAENGLLACDIAELPCSTPSVMKSLIKPGVSIGSGSIIEYSVIGVDAAIGKDCVLSGCMIPKKSAVPDNSFHHTIPINANGANLYVTVAFETNANMKKALPREDALQEICHFGMPLKRLIRSVGSPTLSLWTAKIFPAAKSMDESFDLVILY